MEGAGRRKEERGGVESGDQDVERKFSVKVFPHKRIIMQRSHSPPPPLALPPFLPLSLSLSLILSVPPFFPFSSFSLFFSLSALLA